MGTLNFILILVAINVAPLDAFDLFKKDHLIPSDGFHDVLGLVPFWLSEGFPDQGLKRTLGTRRDDLPTSWQTLTSQPSGSTTYTIEGRCSLEGHFKTDKIVLETKQSGSCEKPSMKMVFDKIFPSTDVLKTTQELINPDSFFVDKIEIDRGSKEVTLEAKAKDSWRILNGENFVLGDASLTLGFKAGEPLEGLKNWKIKAAGTVGDSSRSLKMVIDKLKDETSLPFKWEIENLPMVEIMGMFATSMAQLNFVTDGFDTSKLAGLKFEKPECAGQIELVKDTNQRTTETFQIGCKATISNSPAFKKGEVYLIIVREVGKPAKPAIVIDLDDTTNVQQALKNFMAKAGMMNNFAMLGKTNRNLIIMIAEDDIVSVESKQLMELLKPFVSEYETKQIPQGVNIRIMIPLKENMQKDCSEDVPADVPEQLPMTVRIKTGRLSFSFPDQFKSDMPKFLKCLNPRMKAKLPGQLFPKDGGPVEIKELTVESEKSFTVTVVLKGPFVFMGGKIKISNLELTVKKEEGEDLQFTGVTTIAVGSLAVGLTLEKQSDSYSLTATVDSFRLSQLKDVIGENSLTDFIGLLGNMSNFGVKDFKLAKDFGAGNEHKLLRVSGKPILWGWENCYIEGLIWKPKEGTDQPPKAVAVGIVLEEVRLDKVMERIFGRKLFSTAWFSEMTAVIIVSNANGKVESSSNDEGETNNVGDAEKSEPKTEPKKRSDALKLARANQKASEHQLLMKRSRRNRRPHLRNSKKKLSKRTAVNIKRHINRTVGVKNVAQKTGLRKLNLLNQTRAGVGRPQPEVKVSHAKTGEKKTEDEEKEEEDGGEEKEEEEEGEEEEEEEEEEEVVKFSIPNLSSRDIEKGLTFVGIFKIPKENGCKGDALCLWLAEKVGKDATIEISGAISRSGFKFSAMFTGTIALNADGSLALQSIKLELELSGKESTVKLECTLNWKIPENLGSGTVKFVGAIEVSLTGKLSLQFAMVGTWLNPFKYQYLALSNLNLAIGISVGAGGVLPTFEFGGTVWIGEIEAKGENEHAIKVSIYFGVDFNKPEDNYVYGSINKFTLKQIYEAFKLGSPSVPKLVAESGFPEGLTVSYSMNGKTIESLNMEIPKGVFFKGTINILGLTVAAEILINPPDELLVDVALSPIDWAGGLITLRRSEKDKKNGPKAFINIKPDSVSVQIEGYVSLLGVSSYAYINVTDSYFKFKLESDLWGIIRSKLYVEAAYGAIDALDFSFRASVSVDLKKIADAAMAYLNKAKEIANKKLEEAQKRVAEAVQKVENAERKMDGWKRSIDDYQNRLRRRSAEIEEAKRQLQNSCKEECGEICIPFLDWNPQCFKIWYWWVGCPSWNSCRWKAPNVICIAACEIKKLAKKFVAWAEQTGIKIMIGFAEIGKGLIDVGKGFVTMAKKLVAFANTVLEFVKDVVAAGIEISQRFLNWAGDNLFKVDLLELRGKLTSDFNACVGITCKFTILGLSADYTGDICINLKFWDLLAANAVETKYKGTKKMLDEVPNIDGRVREFDSDKNDLDKKEDNIEKDVEKETKDRRKRDYVPTAEEMYYRRLAEEPLPVVVTRSTSTVNAFKNGAPWVLVQDFDNRNFDHTPYEDSNIPAEKRTLDEDWHKHHATPCVVISKVIDKYSMIADGLRSLHDSMVNVRQGYQATKRSMQQGVDDLGYRVKSTEMKHNITHEERGDLYHWYNEAKQGMEKWDSKARDLLTDEHNLMLPRFRSQIEHILKKEKNQNFDGYMNELHEVGQAAYKRSNIPSESGIAAAKELHRIKKDLVELVSKGEANQLKFGTKVRSIQTNISGLKRSMKRCS